MGAVRQAFGRNLAYHRERLGLTQAALAEKVDTSPSYIGHLERGERDPSLVTVEQLSKALGITAGELFVIRDPEGLTSKLTEELHELLRGRADEDLRLVIRLARAAFQDPRVDPNAPMASARERVRIVRHQAPALRPKKRARAAARSR